MSASISSPVRTRTDAVRGTAIARGKALFGAAAFLSLVASVGLFFTGSREQGIFVGLWVPSILAAGALLLAGGEDR